MRQAGILAAAGIVALETMVDRLAEDHANAKRLGHGLASIQEITMIQEEIQTNIIMFELSPKISVNFFNAELDQTGVKLSSMGGHLFRATTHRMISQADVDEATTRIKAICRKLSSK